MMYRFCRSSLRKLARSTTKSTTLKRTIDEQQELLGCCALATTISTRSFATRRKMRETSSYPKELLDNLVLNIPAAALDSGFQVPGVNVDAFKANLDSPDATPVTSAHCIDVESGKLSTLDSVAISPDGGKIVHGRYGDLPDVALSIPLEYLALLRPAAEAAAAVRVISNKSKTGTLLVYGATQATGFAASMIATGSGYSVVSVVGGEHSGNADMVEYVKGLINEPGTAVPEEYALSKKNFADLVSSIASGNDVPAAPTAEKCLEDFKTNFLEYAEHYPSDRPAAVSKEILQFKYMEKERENFEANMEAYLEQFTPASPPIDPVQLNALFTTEQYQIFREKFWQQTSAILSGDDFPFSAAHIAKDLMERPQTLDRSVNVAAGPKFPFHFSILDPHFPTGTETKAGGPVLGAIIAVTPYLKKAAARVAQGKTLREKAEALQFLTHAEKAAYGAACSVAAQARKAGAPVVTIGGSLPELEQVKETDADIKAALAAMDVGEDGESILNYFVQVYAANEWPFYGSYAIFRASEELAGPRQIIVTK